MILKLLNKIALNVASEKTLRNKAGRMRDKMESLNYDSRKYTRIYFRHNDVVNAISSRFPVKLPPREHGWYLPNDD